MEKDREGNIREMGRKGRQDRKVKGERKKREGEWERAKNERQEKGKGGNGKEERGRKWSGEEERSPRKLAKNRYFT